MSSADDMAMTDIIAHFLYAKHLCILAHLNFTAVLWGGHYHHAHLTEQETEAVRGKLMCSTSFC